MIMSKTEVPVRGRERSVVMHTLVLMTRVARIKKTHTGSIIKKYIYKSSKSLTEKDRSFGLCRSFSLVG